MRAKKTAAKTAAKIVFFPVAYILAALALPGLLAWSLMFGGDDFDRVDVR